MRSTAPMFSRVSHLAARMAQKLSGVSRKRALFAIAGTGLVLGLTACGHQPFSGGQGGEGRGGEGGERHHMGMSHHGQHSEADMQKHRDRMVERVSSQLSLDAAQKAKLVTLIDTMHAKRAAMMGQPPAGAASGPQGGMHAGKQGDMAGGHEGHGRGPGGPGMMPPPEQVQALIKGERFDRAGAQKLVDDKANAMRAASPDVITAMGDFYDSLKPEQQTKVREFLSHAPRRGMMGGHHD